jgi:hypothetical protein
MRKSSLFGIDEDRDALRPRRRDGLGDDRRREHALGIVREDHCLAPGQGGPHRRQHRLRLRRIGRPGRLVIDPDHLLGAGDDAHLADGRAAGALHHPVLDPRIGAEQRPELRPRGIPPEQPDQHRAAAEGGDVARHVAGAARHRHQPALAQHGHRRLGRDALHLAIEEAVEHGIAEDEDAEGAEVEHGRGNSPRSRS